MTIKENEKLSVISVDLHFLLIAIEKDDPKTEIKLRASDIKKSLDELIHK